MGPTHVLGSLCRPILLLLTGTLFFCVFKTAALTTKYRQKALGFFSTENESQRRIRVCCSKLVRRITRLLDTF